MTDRELFAQRKRESENMSRFERFAGPGWGGVLRLIGTLLALLALPALLLTGCAGPFGASHATEFRHPDTGQMQLCYHADAGALVLGGLVAGLNGAMAAGRPYSQCIQTLTRAGYITVPIDAEGQAALAEYDRQRAESIRRP